MRLVGPSGGRPGPPSGRGVGQVGGPEPAADRRRAGPGELGLGVGEDRADQFGPPGRMVASQVEDGLSDRLGMSVGRTLGRGIAGDQARLTLVTATFQEMTDGSWREGECVGQRDHAFALGGPLPEFLPHGDGN